ncbi:MAG: DUF1566 domain-containing protein [Candidatus Nitronauta litoralis]|uniref:DUF1566 domain-containing protein n=1 Tax=Candidatus Nitronauta litoralis TaxID=2705533 RepID=A0A7T0FZV1_9BACT|nr:MAG: DUF1566 domain-containing protein [Candidatus Nitronauta litoralis]
MSLRKAGSMKYFSIPAIAVLLSFQTVNISYSDETMDCTPSAPYEAPPYVEPRPESKAPSKLVDNRNGTITDPESGLIWTQKDSYADLNKCLTWPEAVQYVENLNTAGFSDWRLPTIKELLTIYDTSREGVLAWDKNPEYPLALDDKFSDGAAYWYWSNECGKTKLSECCAKSLYFVKGHINLRHFDLCNNGGVRAVRDLKK